MPELDDTTKKRLPIPINSPLTVSAGAAAILALLASVNYMIKTPPAKIVWNQTVFVHENVEYNPTQLLYQYRIINPKNGAGIGDGSFSNVTCVNNNHVDGWDCETLLSQIANKITIDTVELEIIAAFQDSSGQLISEPSDRLTITRAFLSSD